MKPRIFPVALGFNNCYIARTHWRERTEMIDTKVPNEETERGMDGVVDCCGHHVCLERAL